MEKENKKYKVGLDISSIGYFVLLEQNKIIDICQVPQKSENKELNKQLVQLKKDSKITELKKDSLPKPIVTNSTVGTTATNNLTNVITLSKGRIS